MSKTILRLLHRLLESDSRPKQNRRFQVKPALRLLTVLLTILLCALARNALFTAGVLAVGLARLAFLPAKRLPDLLKRLLAPVLFTALVLLPAVFLGHPRTLLTVSMKVAESVLLLLLLGEDLDWREITGALQSFRLPELVTMTLDMTLRFLVLLGRHAGAMAEALTLRTVSARQKDRRRMQAAGGILGSTFLVSQKLSSETWEAMECRGWQGVYRVRERRAFQWQDWLYCLLIPLLVLAFFYCEKAMKL